MSFKFEVAIKSPGVKKDLQLSQLDFNTFQLNVYIFSAIWGFGVTGPQKWPAQFEDW